LLQHLLSKVGIWKLNIANKNFDPVIPYLVPLANRAGVLKVASVADLGFEASVSFASFLPPLSDEKCWQSSRSSFLE
jgi:hypothetical protein